MGMKRPTSCTYHIERMRDINGKYIANIAGSGMLQWQPEG